MRIPAQGFSSYSRGLSQQGHPQWRSCYPFTPHSWRYPAQKTQAPVTALTSASSQAEVSWKEELRSKTRGSESVYMEGVAISTAETSLTVYSPKLAAPAETEGQPGPSWVELDRCPWHLRLSIPEQEVLSPAGDTGGRTGTGQRRLQGQREAQTPSCPHPLLSGSSL